MKKRDENLRKLGKRIRELREQKGISSQIELANKTGMDRTYIGGIERGERNPTFEILERLAKALGITLSELVHFHGENYSSGRRVWMLGDGDRK